MLTFKIFNHQDKSRLYEEALSSRYLMVNKDPYFVFSDQAIFGRQRKMKKFYAQQYFIYPHSGYPNITNDIKPIWKPITAEFVASEGHREIMRMYGHHKPIHVVGWHLCEIKPFVPSNVEYVLFAPIHPRCDEMDKEVNRRAFNILRKIDGIHLTVRYIPPLEDCGLEFVEQKNIQYTEGSLSPAVGQIDASDVVVAYETFLTLAVARGVPAVSFGADMPTHLIPLDQDIELPKHWYKYLPFLRYPLDLFDGDARDILEKASDSDEEIRGWRYRMIGEKMFNSEKFLNRLEKYL